MKKAMEEYWKEGFQIHIHTNGDLAMEVVLNIVEELNTKWPRGSDHRTTIEHAGFFTKEQAKLLAKLIVLYLLSRIIIIVLLTNIPRLDLF